MYICNVLLRSIWCITVYLLRHCSEKHSATSFFRINKTKMEFLFVSRIICRYDVCIEIQLITKFVQVFRILYYSFCNTNHSLFFQNSPTWVCAFVTKSDLEMLTLVMVCKRCFSFVLELTINPRSDYVRNQRTQYAFGGVEITRHLAIF